MGRGRDVEVPRSRKMPLRWIIALVVVVVGVGITWFVLAPSLRIAPSDSVVSLATAPATARRETRPTLDPALFVGKARLAHQIAREIPDVLDRLYCYCECDKQFGHKSLLSCYTDGHAAT